MDKQKIGVVDVGGGLRGMYATGVLDHCLDDGIYFDLGIGISAGSANLASYLAGQKGRNYKFFAEYTFRKEYMSINNFLHKKTYIDMDYVYGTLSNSDGENPLDYQALMNNPASYIVIASDAETGEAKYFTKDDIELDHYDVLKASSAIPFVCHPYEVKGRLYYDGAISDTIPLQKAFDLGCDKVVLLLTKPKDVIRDPKKDALLANMIKKKYPLAAEGMRHRAEKYNNGVALAKEYEKQGKVLIVAPDDTCGVDTLTKDKEALRKLYEKGYKDEEAIKDFLSC